MLSRNFDFCQNAPFENELQGTPLTVRVVDVQQRFASLG
jgi:hypothetical protein